MPRQRGRSEDEACGVTAFVFRVEQPIYAHILTVHCVFTGELPVDYSTSKWLRALKGLSPHKEKLRNRKTNPRGERAEQAACDSQGRSNIWPNFQRVLR